MTSAPVGLRHCSEQLTVAASERQNITVRKEDSMLSWGMDMELTILCDVTQSVLAKSAKVVTDMKATG
jgi:hypothetical protein